MTLRVVGAGLGRTGTHSLKIALEQLLGGPCYHMLEVFGHPEHVPLWQQAVDGDSPDWDVLFEGSIGRTDLPGGDFEEELRSIRTKLFILDPETHVYPGHGPATRISDERSENPFVVG